MTHSHSPKIATLTGLLSASLMHVAFLMHVAEPAILIAQENRVVNGDFTQWDGDVPLGWTIKIGARNGGDEPVSQVQRIVGPALLLRGDADTMAWNAVSQDIELPPGARCKLTFEARCKDVRRVGNQHDNCYVGLMSFSGSNKLIGRSVKDLSNSRGDWERFSTDYTVPEGATRTSVMLFLSKSGMLGIKGIEVVASDSTVASTDNLLADGTFQQWSNDKPSAWSVEIGANNGADQPLSKLTRIDNGIALSGDARTLAWQTLRQDVDLRPGATYTLALEAVSEAVRREGRQFDNCYVGVMCFDKNGKRVAMQVEDLSKLQGWTRQQIAVVPPPTTQKTSVLIFLSKSGTLKVKNLHLGEAVPGRPFRRADR